MSKSPTFKFELEVRLKDKIMLVLQQYSCCSITQEQAIELLMDVTKEHYEMVGDFSK